MKINFNDIINIERGVFTNTSLIRNFGWSLNALMSILLKRENSPEGILSPGDLHNINNDTDTKVTMTW